MERQDQLQTKLTAVEVLISAEIDHRLVDFMKKFALFLTSALNYLDIVYDRMNNAFEDLAKSQYNGQFRQISNGLKPQAIKAKDAYNEAKQTSDNLKHASKELKEQYGSVAAYSTATTITGMGTIGTGVAVGLGLLGGPIGLGLLALTGISMLGFGGKTIATHVENRKITEEINGIKSTVEKLNDLQESLNSYISSLGDAIDRLDGAHEDNKMATNEKGGGANRYSARWWVGTDRLICRRVVRDGGLGPANGDFHPTP